MLFVNTGMFVISIGNKVSQEQLELETSAKKANSLSLCSPHFCTALVVQWYNECPSRMRHRFDSPPERSLHFLEDELRFYVIARLMHN